MEYQLFIFLLISVIIIISSLYVSYLIKKYETKNKHSFIDFLNNDIKNISFKDIILGLSFGIALGFVDTVGIWLGVENISKYIKGNIKIKAAVGNMYSNLLGISVGTAVAITMSSILKTSQDDAPIYLNAIGSIIGALLGIFIGNMFL